MVADPGNTFIYKGAKNVMHRTLRAAMTAVALLGASLPAAAQSTPWEDRVFGGISFAFEGGADDISESRSFTVYGENGTVSSTTDFDADALIDLTVGARVWQNAGVALAYTSKSSTGVADITGSVPHPLFFDRPRAIAETIDGIDRDESAIHLQFGWMFPVNDRIDVFVYLGPSFYDMSQEVVTDLAVAEQGPPVTTVVVQPTIQEREDGATGYNLGADATYMLYTRDRLRVGVGAFLRFTGATAELTLSDGNRVQTDLGGTQFGFGARFRF